MNRLAYIIMLKNLLELYLDGNFSYEAVTDIINRIGQIKYDENVLALLETEILNLLLENIPYYKIERELSDFSCLLRLTTLKDDNYYRNARMIKSCLEEMIPTIKRIINMAAKENILKLINTQNNLDYLDPKIVLESFSTNLSDPKIISGLCVARNYFDGEYKIPIMPSELINLREKISRFRANKSDSISKSLRSDILKYFNEKTFEEFITKINEIISNSNLEEKEHLNMIVSDILDKLYIYAVPKWSEQDDYQLSLKLEV